MPVMSFVETIVYAGRLVAPILLWLSAFSILKAYIKRSSLSFTTRVTLYFVLFFACLLFLILVRFTEKTPHPPGDVILKQ